MCVGSGLGQNGRLGHRTDQVVLGMQGQSRHSPPNRHCAKPVLDRCEREQNHDSRKLFRIHRTVWLCSRRFRKIYKCHKCRIPTSASWISARRGAAHAPPAWYTMQQQRTPTMSRCHHAGACRKTIHGVMRGREDVLR